MEARSELLFEATTPLGFRVRVDRTRWQLIVNEKHPAMKGREADVTVSLENPDEVRQSKSDDAVQNRRPEALGLRRHQAIW